MSRLLFFTLFAAALVPAQAQTVANGTAEPAQIRTGQATRVRFFADIGDPNLVAGGVNLQRIGPAGTNPVIVGTLLDDGTGGDEIAGDGRYSLYVTLNEPQASEVTFVISAAIKGQVVRPKSANIVVNVLANRPPVAVPGAAASVRTGTTVQLDGRNSYDLDGDIIAFSWSITGKPVGSNASLDNSTFVKPVFTPDLPGTYQVQLLVNDGKATSAVSTVSIQASSTNAGPTALIGGGLLAPFGAGATKLITLDGTASFDPENAALTYSWKLISKPASSVSATFAPLISSTPLLTADKPGRYVVELTVSDGTNLSTPVRATVILYRPNTPPLVTVGADANFTSSTLVTLSSTSSDPDAGDSVASLSWAFISKPVGSTAGLQNPTSSTPSFTPDLPGDYLVELVASDTHGFLTKARVVIRRSVPIVIGNMPPTVNAGSPQTVTLPGIATLNATASDDGLPNPPGVLTISWIQVSGATGVTFSNPASLSTTATFYSPGPYVLRVTANDGSLSSTSDVTITVNDTGPTLTPITDRTISLGQSFRLELLANSTNPTAALTFTLPSAPAGAAINPNPIVNWTPTSAQLGQNTFTARVADQVGRSDQKTFHVMVLNTNHPPVLAGQPDASIAVGMTFSRTLTASDPDVGNILTFALVSGPVGMTVNGANLSWVAAGAASSILPVVVQVSDQFGGIDVKQFHLTLVPSTPPVAVDDSYTVQIGQTLTVPAATGVLANDTSPLGLPMTASKLTNPLLGSLTAFGSDGGFTFQAPAAIPAPLFNPVLKSHADSDELFVTNPLVADLDGDGKAEIVVQVINFGGAVRAYRQDGTILWQRGGNLPAPNASCLPYALSPWQLALGDVDDDGHPDVVGIATCGDGYLHVFALNGPDGAVKWVSGNFNLLTTGGFLGPLQHASMTIARLHAAETPSVLFGVNGTGVTGVDCANLVAGNSFQFCNGVVVLDGATGNVRNRMISQTNRFFDQSFDNNGIRGPIVADLDQNGTSEIVFGGQIYSADGALLSSLPNSTVREFAIGNFDDTPDIEIVRLESVSNPNFNHRLVVYKSTGAILWTLPLPNAFYSALSVADIDGSGRPSIVFSSSIGTTSVWAVDYKGNLKWTYNVPVVAGNEKMVQWNRHAIFDLDGDGVPEVIVSAVDQLLFLDGSTGKLKFSFNIGSVTSDVINPNQSYQTPAPVVADLDGSGHAQIVFTWVAQNASFAGTSGGWLILQNQNHDWRPVRGIMNQYAYFGSNINNNGTVPALPLPNNFATPATNLFGGAQPPIGPVPDPRKKSITTFTYAATAGGLTSAPATVSLTIAPLNRPPQFISTAPTRYRLNAAFQYNAIATDPDPGDVVTYKLESLTGTTDSCSIVATTGVLTCNNLSPFPAELGAVLILISATDTQGEKVFQTLKLVGVSSSSAVPNVVGLSQSSATTTLTGSGFALGNITQVYGAGAPGAVLSQSPSGGSTVLLGEQIALTISLGPSPVAVPFVTGLSLSTANTTLATSGFISSVTNVFSNTVPAGTVMSQSPIAGTFLQPIAANAVALVVSAGSGLQLGLNRSAITADQSITVLPLATDANGNPVTTPSLTYAITPAQTPFAGTLPTIAGTTITSSAATRGAFTVTATDAVNNRTASSAFTVVAPHVADQPTHAEAFISVVQTLDQIFALRPQMVAALAAHNTVQMNSLLQQMVLLWRTVDLFDVKTSLPNVLDTGFMPHVQDLQALGMSLTPQDILVHQILRDANADIQTFTNGLQDPTKTIADLNALADQFNARSTLLAGLPVSVIGGVYNGPEYTAFLAHRAPAFLEAFMEEVAQQSGLGRRTSPTPFQSSAAPMGARAELKNGFRQARFTLSEQLTEIVIETVIDKLMDQVGNIKKLYHDLETQAANSAELVVLGSFAKDVLQGDDLNMVGAVIAGGSLSFREFSEPDVNTNTNPPPSPFPLVFTSVIEAPLDNFYPENSKVIIIGPAQLDAVKSIIQGIKDSFSIGQVLGANPNKIKNLNEAKKQFTALYNGLLAVAGPDQTKLYANTFQSGDAVLAGCIFSTDPDCTQLIYTNGFRPVYQYSAPGFGGGGLPVAIVFIVQNGEGDTYVGLESFLPAPVR